MTEHLPESGRIDLRALDESVDPAGAERVIAAALARVTLGAEPASPVSRVTALFAAAALLLLAAGLLLLAPRPVSPEEPASAIADWTASGYQPTNGELLAAFRGYQP